MVVSYLTERSQAPLEKKLKFTEKKLQVENEAPGSEEGKNT